MRDENPAVCRSCGSVGPPDRECPNCGLPMGYIPGLPPDTPDEAVDEALFEHALEELMNETSTL